MVGRIVRGPYRGIDVAALHPLPFSIQDVAVALLLIGLMEGIQWLQRGRTFPQLMSARPVWVRWPAYYALLAADRGDRGPGGEEFHLLPVLRRFCERAPRDTGFRPVRAIERLGEPRFAAPEYTSTGWKPVSRLEC